MGNGQVLTNPTTPAPDPEPVSVPEKEPEQEPELATEAGAMEPDGSDADQERDRIYFPHEPISIIRSMIDELTRDRDLQQLLAAVAVRVVAIMRAHTGENSPGSEDQEPDGRK
jgi:hypothetical protein